MSEPVWHNLSIKNVLELAQTNKDGLFFKEIDERLKKHGLNRLPKEKKFSILKTLLTQFKSPLVYILIIAAAVTLALKEFIDLIVILAAVLINAGVGFSQEYKAEKIFKHLKNLIQYKARVLRQGSPDNPSSTEIKQEYVIDSQKLVPGDIIILEAGDIIPADARLIETHNLETKEAALTGESLPSFKKNEILKPDTPLADRKNMVYSGTNVAKGKAKAVIIATGSKTELGKIANLIRTTEEDKTPLQKKISSLAETLGIIIAGLSLMLFIAGLIIGRPFLEMLLVSVAVAVAGIPEGLPIAVTVCLAVGMQRILKKKALIKKLIAAETLGSITVIALDKTGTLTEGKMAVTHLIPYKDASNKDLLKVGLLCSNIIIENSEQELKNWKMTGDSTEIALVQEAVQAGLERKKLLSNYQRIDEIPFESETMRMATLSKMRSKKNQSALFIKGAPERILDICSLTIEEKREIKKEFEQLTDRGLRVLAFGQKIFYPQNKENLSENDLNNIKFIGLIALRDPLRPETKKAVNDCKLAGIRSVLVTGDHQLTTRAIAQEIGLIRQEEKILQGGDIDRLSDEDLRKKLKKTNVFARVEPKHKIRIVDALQAQGEVVAMTGDGVNDAPAIKSADIGLALGSGSEITKETADIVLLDDNFKTIVEAIKSGRDIFNNIKKIVLFLLSDTFTEFILIGGSLFLGLPLPVLAGQILWINIIEDTLPAMALSYEKEGREILKERARGHKTKILDKKMKFLILVIGVITDLILLGLFLLLYYQGKDIAYIRTMISVGLGIDTLFYVFACKNLKKIIWKYNPFNNLFLDFSVVFGWGMLFVALYVPFFQKILRLVPLHRNDWLIMVGLGLIEIALIELGKFFFTPCPIRRLRDREL